MADIFLRLLTGVVFFIIFCLTAAELVRVRDAPRLEIACLFGVLAGVVGLQGLSALVPQVARWVPLVTSLLLVSQPYLLFRLSAGFQAMGRGQHGLAVVGFVGSAALLVGSHPNVPGWAIGFIVAAFMSVEGLATVAFINAAVSARGITQLRLYGVAIGSGLLAILILLAGFAQIVPGARDIVAATNDFVGLAAAISYYAGFATPRWLRRVWQRAEVYQFLSGIANFSSRNRELTALDYLARAASRAVGGRAVVMVVDADGTGLRLHSAGLPPNMPFDWLPLGEMSPVLSRVFYEQRACSAREPRAWGQPLQELAAVLGGARGALVAPLSAGGQAYGLVVVLVQRGFLFIDDDLETLAILAEQTALAMDNRHLLELAERGRAQLATVMASMSDGLMLLDSAQTIQYANARAAQLLDKRSDELIGRTPQDACNGMTVTLQKEEAGVDPWSSAFARADQGPRFELHVPGAIDREVLVQVFDVVGDAGATRGELGIVLRDVTAERELGRTKDELVSVVSHELRTPLASLVGFAELMQARPSMTEAQRQRYLGVMVEEGRRLTALINDFLDMQRLESGHETISLRPTTLRPLLDQAVAAAGDDPVRPIMIDAPDDLPSVRVDPSRMRQVLANLLSNARKYSPDGGLVRVEARRLDGQVCVSVQDSGLGLPASALPRLFEKFYRVDNSDRREIAGTGLGLAISRRIVEGQGGRIWAESDGLGAGARFSFTVPVALEPAGTGEVLVVEDGGSFAELLEAELSAHGLSSVCVNTAEQAMDQVRQVPPRMVVLDLVLPGMQGEAFLAWLRTDSATARLPVVVVTMKDLTTAEQEALHGFGVQAILRKGPGVAAAAARVVAETLGTDSVRAA